MTDYPHDPEPFDPAVVAARALCEAQNAKHMRALNDRRFDVYPRPRPLTGNHPRRSAKAFPR